METAALQAVNKGSVFDFHLPCKNSCTLYKWKMRTVHFVVVIKYSRAANGRHCGRDFLKCPERDRKSPLLCLFCVWRTMGSYWKPLFSVCASAEVHNGRL